MPKRRTAFRIAAVVFGLLLGLAIGIPGYIVIMTPRPARSARDRQMIDEQLKGAMYQRDDYTSYRMRPNAWGHVSKDDEYLRGTNSLCMLADRELPATGKPQVLVLGDSVAFGYLVPTAKNFPSRMNDRLGNVWNAAVCGWSTRQEVALFEHYLEGKASWQTIILSVCLNDTVEYEWVWTNNRYQMGEVKLTSNLFYDSVLFSKWFKGPLKPIAQHHRNFLLAWDEESWSSHFWPYFDRLRVGRKIIMLVTPLPGQVQAAKRGGDPAIIWRPQQILARGCSQRGVEFVDVAAEFVAAMAPFIDEQCHLSLEGHEIVADRLINSLQKTQRDAKSDQGSTDVVHKGGSGGTH